ncbi:MAG: sigma-54 dependent transcriptional regulator [Candidatus Krumholzibacteria bacterium]|nr:sigma-54 dependent transcriptional regulator [Candidatus Krumholzibacteria bacterium]
MSVVLIVDDITAMREQYAYDLQRLGGHTTVTAAGGRAALEILASEPVDCVILDLEMPDLDGFQVLIELKRRGDTTPVIVYTGTGSFDRCVRAVKLGAYTFLAKDEPLERVVQEIGNAVQWTRLRQEVRQLRRAAGQDSPLLGESGAMRDLRAEIDRLAAIPSPVLILGESGTGKELVARQLHDRGSRARQPFVAVNAAALPETLAESELFGYEKGAFTGADRTRRGAFENADRGTLFLDEIGDLPPASQAKLLRVLETGAVTRLGGQRELRVNVRVVAATNRDLEHAVAGGGFREDLLFRLNVHVLRVPPLRERLRDVPLLVEHFLQQTAERFGQKPKSLLPQVRERLAAHDWRRNNVRELRNVVERLVIAAAGDVIGLDAVPADIGPGAGANASAATAATPAAAPVVAGCGPGLGSLKDQKLAAERAIILAALERNQWAITSTAADLGLADHSSLLKIMRRHGLKR